jgi:hypothetical protein
MGAVFRPLIQTTMIFKLIRYTPQKIEIEITENQVIQMFPIELTEHPNFGIIQRFWKSENQTYSIDNFDASQILDLSTTKIYKRLKDDVMLDILNKEEKLKIVLIYDNTEDVYDLIKLYPQ